MNYMYYGSTTKLYHPEGIIMNVGNYWDKSECIPNYCMSSQSCVNCNFITDRVYKDGANNCVVSADVC